MTTPQAGRTVDRTVTIQATPDQVWRALTDAEELVRWFPLEAEVTPGVGGTIRMRWADAYDDGAAIEVWEEGRHLRIAFPAEGPAPLVTDYHLTGRSGHTVLRVVTSGFGEGDDWDAFYEGVSFGWDFELSSLRHYLERHRGTDRHVAWVRAPYLAAGRDASWERVTGPGGWFGPEGLSDLEPGVTKSVTTSDGTDLSLAVRAWRPPRMLVATVPDWKDALLRLELEGHQGVWLWFATWGVPEAEVRAVERRWRDALTALLEP